MKDTLIQLQNKFPLEIKTSNYAKQIRITVHHDGRVTAVKPQKVSFERFLFFVENKISWIEEKIHFFLTHPITLYPKIHRSKKEILLYRKQARTLVQNRLEYFNQFYRYSYNKVFIKNQKTRWGSCSKNKNLNFNYKIVLLPEKLQDYIIVHELCHLGEFNHSKKFWNLVEKTIPDYLTIKKDLRKIGFTL